MILVSIHLIVMCFIVQSKGMEIIIVEELIEEDSIIILITIDLHQLLCMVRH